MMAMEPGVEARFNRLENIVNKLGEHAVGQETRVLQLDEALATLAEAQIEGVKQTNAFRQEARERFNELEAAQRENAALISELGVRMNELAVRMSEFAVVMNELAVRTSELAIRTRELDVRRREDDERDRERARILDERLDKVIAEMRERDRVTDDRIDKLVSAIGEIIRRQPRAS